MLKIPNTNLQAVDIILKCIKDFAEVSRHVTIIEIVDVKVSVIEEFLKSIKKIFSEKDILLLKEDLIEGRKYERFRGFQNFLKFITL